MYKHLMAAALVLGVVFVAADARAHCQVPCGIYGDELRSQLLREHALTLEKSMKEIVRLSAETPVNYNQVVRWVNNKDRHADEITQIVTEYFLAQRVKPIADTKDEAGRKANEQVVLLHKMIVSAMKAKQTTDLAHVKDLREQLSAFNRSYFGKDLEEHDHH